MLEPSGNRKAMLGSNQPDAAVYTLPAVASRMPFVENSAAAVESTMARMVKKRVMLESS
jgi:hypothetical protein